MPTGTRESRDFRESMYGFLQYRYKGSNSGSNITVREWRIVRGNTKFHGYLNGIMYTLLKYLKSINIKMKNTKLVYKKKKCKTQ